jgi:hypothetical protein
MYLSKKFFINHEKISLILIISLYLDRIDEKTVKQSAIFAGDLPDFTLKLFVVD